MLDRRQSAQSALLSSRRRWTTERLCGTHMATLHGVNIPPFSTSVLRSFSPSLDSLLLISKLLSVPFPCHQLWLLSRDELRRQKSVLCLTHTEINFFFFFFEKLPLPTDGDAPDQVSLDSLGAAANTAKCFCK